jgi:hypothetical protein
VTGEMRATRLPKPKAIRHSLARQDGMVRKVALEERAALAVADLIEWAPLAENVIEAARWVDGSTVNMEMSYMGALDRLAAALAALDAARSLAGEDA